MRRTLTGGVLGIGLLVGAAHGQPAPNDGPPRADRPDARVPARPTVKGTYLGVATSPPTAALRRQVDLPNGVGLLVEAVADDSPAAAAGLKQYDVLHKLNDQVLINQHQLAVLVRTFKPGDEVTLAVVRAGKPTEVKAKLVERDLPPVDELRLLNEDPFNLLPRRPGVPQGRLPGVEIELFPRAGGPPAELLGEDYALSWDDGKVQMAVASKDGKRTLRATSHDGKELYNGPVDTPEQQNALPPEVKERLPHLKLWALPRPAPKPPGTRPAGGEQPEQKRDDGTR